LYYLCKILNNSTLPTTANVTPINIAIAKPIVLELMKSANSSVLKLAAYIFNNTINAKNMIQAHRANVVNELHLNGSKNMLNIKNAPQIDT
jgi:hypothetical protein